LCNLQLSNVYGEFGIKQTAQLANTSPTFFETQIDNNAQGRLQLHLINRIFD